MKHDGHARAVLRDALEPITGRDGDYDTLIELAGDARIVLLGEATHGSREFYRERARITRRLIRDAGFHAVAVEADWPDAYRVNRWVRGTGDDDHAVDALAGFRRFPTWMWRNNEVVAFIEWLREWNRSQPRRTVGFYGIDLYSMFASIDAVIRYLDTVDPDAARRARLRYACFDHYGEDSQAYGRATESGVSPDCEDEAVAQLAELQRRAGDLARRDGRIPEDEFFFAEQNARLVRNAEAYYRSMFRSRVESWNRRDRHMAGSLEALMEHLDRKHGTSRIVVWAHNSHIGDARATEMGGLGERNVGQLAREHRGDAALLVGFTTFAGTVTAASNWDEPAERKRVRPALDGSWEALFHEFDEPACMWRIRGRPGVYGALGPPRLERAIGVIYRPETERVSHWFHAALPEQFDVVIHIDETTALEPLERGDIWVRGEAPETFPFTV